jgi:hypothetical protein
MAVREVLAPLTFKLEMAVSFTDLASRYTVLTRESESIGELPLEEYLDHHTGLPDSVARLVESGTLIEDRLLILQTQSIYQSLTREIALGFDLVECLRRLASMVTETANFMLLHAITVGQALLDIWKWYPTLDDRPMRQGYRDFVVATVLACGLPNASLSSRNEVSIDEVYSRISKLKNDHAQKASYSLTRLHDEFGHSEFLTAAIHYQAAYD